MKKMVMGAIRAALVLSMAVTGAFAAGYDNGRGRNFVDANGDGVCDNYGTGTGRGQYFVDANGDGVCDNYGTGCGRGQYFVDANGDGVCDNYGTGCGRGQGRGCNR